MENAFNEICIGRDEAVMLDQQIKVYANMAWQNLVESCKCLKKMKDTKGYEQLGYATFGEYTKASLNIEERQAYTYISTIEKQGEAFLQLNASLGITKLSLLNAIPDIDRQEFVESHDLAGMSVKEVEKLVKENDQKAEQISMLTTERDDLIEERDDINEDLIAAEKKISQLEEELERERNKPIEVAVAEPDAETLKKIRAEAAESAKEESRKELEEYKAKVAAAENSVAQAVARAEELEKKLTVSASPETTKFTFFFEALESDYQKIIESITEIKKTNPEAADKYGEAMQKYHKIICERFAALGYSMNNDERVHGFWMEDSEGSEDFGLCSVCKRSGLKDDKFCSDCGAVMDKEPDNE